MRSSRSVEKCSSTTVHREPVPAAGQAGHPGGEQQDDGEADGPGGGLWCDREDGDGAGDGEDDVARGEGDGDQAGAERVDRGGVRAHAGTGWGRRAASAVRTPEAATRTT